MAEKMNIVWMNIDNVFPYEKNPRINDDAVEFVKNSIKEFGWKRPIVVDDKKIIRGGGLHRRIGRGILSQRIIEKSNECVLY